MPKFGELWTKTKKNKYQTIGGEDWQVVQINSLHFVLPRHDRIVEGILNPKDSEDKYFKSGLPKRFCSVKNRDVIEMLNDHLEEIGGLRIAPVYSVKIDNGYLVHYLYGKGNRHRGSVSLHSNTPAKNSVIEE